MSDNGKGNGANGLPVVFSCSGASDTGEIGDRAARTLHRLRMVKMSCLAGVAAGVEDATAEGHAADRLAAVDGCDSECAAKLLRKAGFHRFIHLRITDLGFEKGASPATDDNIEEVAEALAELLGVREA